MGVALRTPSVTAEPVWMKSLRAAARDKFAGMAWPSTSEEEWRRTDVSRLGLEGYTPAPALTPACPRDGERGDAAGVIRFQANKCTEVAHFRRRCRRRVCGCSPWTTRWMSSRRPCMRCTSRPWRTRTTVSSRGTTRS